MYQLIGLRCLVKLYAGVAAVVGIATFALWPDPTPSQPWDWFDYFSAPVGVGLTIASALLFVGQTWIFPYICRLPLLRNVFPALDGIWEGELQSNWPLIQRRGVDSPDSTALLVRPATMTINARLLTVSVVLDTKDGYSTSKAMLVGITRDVASDRCCLSYVYENRTPNPKQTDESSHLGAAVLTFEEHGAKLTLKGSYWTNRNWSKGLNTAGIASFQKIA